MQNKDRTRSVYVYPNISMELMGSNNPYIGQLKSALKDNGFEVAASVSQNAFADFVKKGISSDIVILNWMEDLPSRRMGILQSFIIMAYLYLIRLRGVKIIWIKHNKVSHTQKWFPVRKLIQRCLSRTASHIIVHAVDEETLVLKKSLFLPHPCNITPDKIQSPGKEDTPEIDLLLWGSIFPYKGVLEFLQFVQKDSFLKSLNIHIVGKCAPGYWNQLKEHAGQNVYMDNKFIAENELQELFKKTRFILFTYNKKSVLSSGVLMDSLLAGKKMIAPDCGAFRDMAERQQFVSLFTDFADIAALYRSNYDKFILDYTQVCEFVAQNSWYNMGRRIKELTGVTAPLSLTAEIPYPEPYKINS